MCRQRRLCVVSLLSRLVALALGGAPGVLGRGGEGAGVVELGLEVEELADEGLFLGFEFWGSGGQKSRLRSFRSMLMSMDAECLSFVRSLSCHLPCPLSFLAPTPSISHIDPLCGLRRGSSGLQCPLVEPQGLVDGIAERLSSDCSVGDVAEGRAPALRELGASSRRGIGHGAEELSGRRERERERERERKKAREARTSKNKSKKKRVEKM